MPDQYYVSKLSANKLKECYDAAPSRVFDYLIAEIRHVMTHIERTDKVLELGCGYGRVLEHLLSSAQRIVGIDISKSSLELARTLIQREVMFQLCQMDAINLGFQDSTFNKTICIQNGISAFKVDPDMLIMESIRVTKNGGKCLFSSYSDAFWNHRLEWFVIQSERGLVGEIDWDKTRKGLIVCKDGFRSATFGEDEFRKLTSKLKLKAQIIEVDRSSLFCVIEVEK